MLFDIPGNTVFMFRVSYRKIPRYRDGIHLMDQGAELLFERVQSQDCDLFSPVIVAAFQKKHRRHPGEDGMVPIISDEDQARLAAFPLDDGIRCKGGGKGNKIGLSQCLLGNSTDGLPYTLNGILRRSGCLRLGQDVGPVDVDNNGIGKSSPCVDPEPEKRGWSSRVNFLVALKHT